MDPVTVERYLERIGVDRSAAASPATLRALHRAHLLTVPFENLSIHLGEAITLDQDALVDKLITRRRGGFCYELNGAFASLLGALGFDVSLLAARPFVDDHVGPPFDHLVLRVDTPEAWLVDVGFGAHSLYPLRLDLRGPQVDPGGTFTVADSNLGDVEVARDGTPQYRIEMRRRALVDFEPMCWWHQTSPRSHFTRSLTCSLATTSGRVTLSGRRLIRTVDGKRSEVVLGSDAEVLAAYREYFGIVLANVPHVRTTP
jgi:N-hydroxyarylamine O-acetyltransferase